MLEHLFGSKTRVKLLRIFLNHPENFYYVRELTRLINLQINSVRRELQNLEKLEIISRFKEEEIKEVSASKGEVKNKKQQKKYYKANVDYVLFPELKALMLKAQLLLEYDLVKKIRKMGIIKYLALTGIFVGFIGAPTDLFIVGNLSNINKNKLSKLISKFEKELNYEINFTLISLSEYKYRKDITDRFLYSILENKKIVVVDEINK